MAPIDPTNSARYFLDYTVAGFGHTLEMRVDGTVADADAISVLNDFMSIVGANCFPIVVTGFRFAQAGHHNSNDVAWTGDTGWGGGSPFLYHTAWYYDFVGRDSDGVRVRVAVFGANTLQEGGDYRISSAEESWVADAITSLTQDGQMFWTVNQLIPVWKNYANCGVNAYWRNKVR